MPWTSRITVTLLLFFGLSVSGSAQSVDTQPKPHSPRKATLLSTFLPGAGQIYNRKYWKLPIVYGGMGLSIYYLDRNIKDVRYFKDNLIALQDDDPNTVDETGLGAANLQTVIDQRKSWRDWSYVALFAVYGLQILDASVDAHLFYFDVDEDLTLNVLPYVDPTTAPSAGVFMALHF